VAGLIPTGWYPESVTLSKDGRRFFVVNGKSNPGPGAWTLPAPPATTRAGMAMNYVWQLEKAGLFSAPVPAGPVLGELTLQVAANNHFPSAGGTAEHEHLMAFLRSRIKHVIYIIKENRTTIRCWATCRAATATRF